MFSSLPPLFFLPLEEKLHNMVWKKKSPSWKGRETLPLQSQSADSLYWRKKKETILLEADVDTASLLKIERVH